MSFLRRISLRSTIPFVFLILFAALLQWVSGTYDSELGENADEAAHLVTTLMVRDYLLAGAPWPPMRYAERYYEHYPKVALGHWPPGYYVISAVWMLVFPASKASLLALQALLAGLAAGLLFYVAGLSVTVPIAFSAAVCFLITPLVIEASRDIMSDLLVVLLMLAGVMLLIRLMDCPDNRYAPAFGLVTAAALLTKGTAVLLAAAAPVSVVLSRRWDVFRRAWFWAALALAVAVAAPWYRLTPGAMHERALPDGPLDSLHALQTHANTLLRCVRAWIETIGPWMSIFLAMGVSSAVVVPFLWRRRVAPQRATLAALLVTMLVLFQILPPIRDARHTILILPALLVFSLEGIRWLLDRRLFSRLSRRTKVWAAALLLPLLLLVSHRPLPPKRHAGFGAVAAYLAAGYGPGSTFLVSSDAQGEGMLVAEVAMRDQRPGRRVVRATKILSRYDWLGGHEKLLYSSTQEVRTLLDRGGVQAVVFDEEPSWVPVHHRLLKQTLEMYPADWRLAASFPRLRGERYSSDSLRVYVRQIPLPNHSEALPLRQLPLRRR